MDAYLLLRDVDRMSRHGSSEDEVPRALFPEIFPSGTSTVIGPGEIDVDNMMPIAQPIIETPSLGRDARVRNHNIQAAEILHNGMCCRLDLFRGRQCQLSGHC